VRTREHDLDTTATTTLDVTDLVAGFARDVGGDGLVHVFLPHATAGLALFETGSGTEEDVVEALDRLLPTDERWQHRHGSAGHGRDHVVPLLVSPSLTVPVDDGQLALGTWQSVVVVDTNRDNPRRRLRLSFLSG
jgi:secondary thiamine-phosphate synthase enzyme